MKNNRKSFFILTIAIIIILILIYVVLKKSSAITQNDFSTTNYSLKYDTTWKIEESTDNSIKLIHKDSKSQINISIKEIDTDLYGKSLEDIANTVQSNIEQENSNYKCISKNTQYINDNLGEVYELLFENGQSQSMVVVGTHGYKIAISNFSAENKYFDILLDSVQNINSNFNILDKQIELTDLEDIETTGLTVKTSEEDYSEVSEYELYGSNYYVKYTIPNKIKITKTALSQFVTGIEHFKEQEESGDTSITVTVNGDNIFQELKDIKNDANISKNSITKTEIEKLSDNNLNGYCYKYDYYNQYSSKEKYYIVYALGNYNNLSIEISGENITQNLIDNIKIIDYHECSYDSYIDRTSNNGYLEGNLETYEMEGLTDYSTMRIAYSVPDKYTEIWNRESIKSRSFIYGSLRNDDITKCELDTFNFYDYNIDIELLDYRNR